jgi:hypothetical protein
MNSPSGSPLRRILATLAIGLFVTTASATQSRPLNLEEMTERAATFRVERSIKGSAGKTITVRMPWASPEEFPAGVPSFASGDNVVLFLYGESASGMRAPVGLGQGRFRILSDKQGRKVAINDVGNRNLMQRVSASTRERLVGVPGLSLKGALDPDRLMDAADGLIRAHR